MSYTQTDILSVSISTVLSVSYATSLLNVSILFQTMILNVSISDILDVG